MVARGKSRTTASKKTAARKTAQASKAKKASSAVKKKAAPKAAAAKTAPKTEGKKKMTAREKKIQEIRKKLISQRDELLSEAETAMNSLPDQTVFPDLGDQATAETDRNFMLRLRGREQRLLKKIEEAIDRIDSGDFGICDVCGNEIGIKRLEARPVTTMCIECKMEQEEEEKLMAQ
jgi:DnaK suppressor protein